MNGLIQIRRLKREKELARKGKGRKVDRMDIDDEDEDDESD